MYVIGMATGNEETQLKMVAIKKTPTKSDSISNLFVYLVYLLFCLLFYLFRLALVFAMGINRVGRITENLNGGQKLCRILPDCASAEV